MRTRFNQKTQYLVALAKDGDQTALENLCKVYGERVQRIVRLRMGREIRSRLDSVDVVQDALIHALRGLEDFTYNNEGDFLRWLSTIAQNALRDHLDKLHTEKRDIRKEVRVKSYVPTTGGGFAAIPSPIDSTTPSAIASKREDLDKLEKAIDQLKPEHREVIVLTKIEGLSYKEIAEKLGKSSEAARKLVSRAMTALISAFESVGCPD